MKKNNYLYRGHRFPAAVISQAVRWYFRFHLSLRGIEGLLFERGVTVSYETIRRGRQVRRARQSGGYAMNTFSGEGGMPSFDVRLELVIEHASPDLQKGALAVGARLSPQRNESLFRLR